MKDAPVLPSGREVPTHVAGPRESITLFVTEVCRDLEASKSRLSTVDTVDALIVAATETHKTLADHEQTMGQFVQFVQSWRQGAS